MKPIKAAVIGAGSTYTPELAEGFLRRREELPLDRIVLMDIDPAKLEIVGGLVRRMFGNQSAKVVLTTDRAEALKDADFVLAQIRVGGLAARILDEKIPLKHGLIGQETTGIGGFFKALRTVPVLVDIARSMEKLCPDAWLVNFSNPSGLVADALLNRTNVRAIGLCNCPINMFREVRDLLGAKGAGAELEYVGLNHLSWITAARSGDSGGRDLLPELLAGGLAPEGMKNIPKLEYEPDFLETIRAYPSGYLNYFYFRGQELKRLKSEPLCRGEVCRDIEADLLRKYADPGLKEKPPELDLRGGHLYSEAAVSLVSAIHNDAKERHVVDVLNEGALDFMEDDDVVEIVCVVGRDGPRPVPVRNFRNGHIRGLMRAVKAYEKLAAEAALSGDRGTALQALLVHPLLGDYDAAKAAFDELLQAHREHLPRFFA